MNAIAFRHFYAYHFTENRKIWVLRPPLKITSSSSMTICSSFS
jgi:hypothetical protein